jgi:hypothetical protein
VARGAGVRHVEKMRRSPDSSCAKAAPDRIVAPASAAALVLMMERMVSSLLIRIVLVSLSFPLCETWF